MCLLKTYGQVEEPDGDCLEPKHEFWYPGFVLNRSKNQNLERDGATKQINYSGFRSVLDETLDSFMLEDDKNCPLTRGNLVRSAWSRLKTAAGGAHPKRRRIAKPGNPSSKKAKEPKPSTALNAPSASAGEQVPAAVDQGGEATGNGAQVQAPAGAQVPDAGL